MNECDGLCLTSADIGIPGYGIAYPHPGITIRHRQSKARP